VHGYNDSRLQFFCGIGCYCGIDGEEATNGDQENINLTDIGDLLFTELMS